MVNVWPAGLPQSPLIDSFSEQVQDTRVRTTFDSGPPQMRRRFTATLRYFSCAFILTKAQVATLDAFVQTTLNGGTSQFQWKHPRTGATINLRFVEIPSYDGYSADEDGPLFRVQCKLEMLP